MTVKHDLATEPNVGHLAVNQTYPTAQYSRFHQTSGTRGRPQILLETAQDWEWWLATWQTIYDAADVRADDRVLMAFSFGPFIGFWSAFEAAVRRGCLLLPCGGMSTRSRIEMIAASGTTVVLCTPTYALHMAEVGIEHKMPLAELGVRQLVLAGEPGGSIPAVRERIAKLWNAHVHDHAGATEVGPWGYGDRDGKGLFVIESEFIADFFKPGTSEPASEGELSELVLTCLGRRGCPIFRYRTGDIVRPIWKHNYPTPFVFLEGGILGRADDMIVVRGVNIFPSSIEAIVREFPSIVEYRVTVSNHQSMTQIKLEIEDAANQNAQLTETLRSRLGLKVDVTTVNPHSLPRFEGKSKRWIDERKK
jgi:phenylacetate-CoA ligase